MKRYIQGLILVFFLTPSIISAQSLVHLLFESAIETDYMQSLPYWDATPRNPIKFANGWQSHEGNPLVRSLSPVDFRASIAVTRGFIRYSDSFLPEQFASIIQISATIIELSVIIWNDYTHEKYLDFPRAIMMSYSFAF